MNAPTTLNRRRHERFILPPMYSPVLVHRHVNMSIAPLDGHAYDASEGGIRFEIDEPLEVGETVTVQLELPGGGGPVTATGRVVRVHDPEDDPGPRRAAVHIERYLHRTDRERLLECFGRGILRRAA
jgi:hypothetical protein